MSAALAPFVSRVVAVDGSPTMLEAAGERLAAFDNVDLRRASSKSCRWTPASWTRRCSTWCCTTCRSRGAALAEVARGLAPGGRLLIVDMLPHDRQEYRQEMGHVWLGFEERQLARWLEAAGFEELRTAALPPDPEAKGPTLFAATARRARDLD